jgi:hypothetical protein
MCHKFQHGPTFIFPLNQQQAAAAAAAASVRPGSVKSLPVTSNGPPSSTSNSAQPNTSGTGAAAAPPPTMSFTYPNMPGNETQYMAILQNNAYPFPIPAHVGGPPGYRGNPAQAFPFFNGSFYSSQMINPSQIQPQQLPAQSQQSQQGHPNATISTGSSSSQKHAQNQQQKANNANGSNGGGSGSLQGFPVTKNPHQQLILQQQQQRQQLHSHHTSNAARQVESEMGCEDSPSTADSRLNRATMNIYGQNFAMPPMQTPNFTLMTTAMSGGGSNANHSEKKQQQQQHPGSKAGGETSPAFAMPFASINGATGLDLSSIAHNHSIMQSNHNYQIMQAQAASAQMKKNYHAAEEGKHVVNSSNLEEDRKAMSGKNSATVGQSIAFARSDVADTSMSSLACNNVIDSSGRSLNLGSASSRASVSVMPAAINANAAGSQQQMQRNQPQIPQLHQKQNQYAATAAAASRNKTPATSNGSIYSDNLPSTSSISAKYPNAVSAFPQSLVQSSNTVVTQSPQWKNSARAATNTSMSPSTMASLPSLSVKNPPQQQARSQQGHTQISFAANPKSSTPQVQTASSTQSPSPPVMVGSPTNSSMSKNTSSPRTTNSTTTNNKTSQASSLSSQQAKNSPTMPTRKSSPVGGRNVPSILSGPQITPSSNTGSKSQLSQQQQKQQQQQQQHQQQQQQQISKQNLQQAQMFFSNPYMHSQVTQSNSPTSTASPVTGYYPQRRGPEQVQRQGSGGTSANGAAANNNSKGSTLNTQGVLLPSQFAAMQPSGNHHQYVPAGFYNVQPVPTAVQVKPAEQKQPAGE